MAFFVGAAAGRYRHMKSIICVSFMHNQTGRLYVLHDLSRIHNLGHKNGLIRVHFREFCFGFTFWDTKTAENVTLFVNRAAHAKRGPAPRRKQAPKAVWNGQEVIDYLTPKSSSPYVGNGQYSAAVSSSSLSQFARSASIAGIISSLILSASTS